MKAQTTFTKVLKTKNLQLAAGLVVAMTFSNHLNAQNNTSYSDNDFPIGGTNNCAIGVAAISSGFTTTGNTAVGSRTLTNTSGNDNVAIGNHALHNSSTGNNNAANGSNVLFKNTTGSSNVANGANAMYSNTVGTYNTATGAKALYANTVANRNSAFGWEALVAANGNHNAAFGFRALFKNTSGSENTGCGTGALGSNTTGAGNSSLGTWSDVGAGNLSNATAIGYTSLVNASNKVRIGNASVTVIEGQVAYSWPSDGRFKTNVKEEDVKGLEFIKKLRPVVYNFDTRKFTEFWTKNMPEDVRKEHLNQDFTASTNVRQSGFIAQEVESAAKEANYDFNGVHVPENENDNYSLAYAEFVVPLVKAVQEQQKIIEGLQQQINDMQKGQGSATGIGNSLSVTGASMDQNVPNPFSTETVISFNLPNQIGNAYMTVYDLSGRQIKTLPISKRGASSITITSDQLEAGMYIYSIVADGKIVDSKRMVVTGK
ncbi:T9SS type A sorting domain-containing protein [Taibaiella lutea]|uniref:T9SS type A sorting domain-containing protein n=1 Tax=Taibaiella lutea TaxID=2608001 RepID=A0A5M6CF93_9BACT|nr:tail fiber domain-containing protein [Taibaiella lutea]KAA5532115.1 T9SS type A sorting domain-containing protein [Taibaiella lutea]